MLAPVMALTVLHISRVRRGSAALRAPRTGCTRRARTARPTLAHARRQRRTGDPDVRSRSSGTSPGVRPTVIAGNGRSTGSACSTPSIPRRSASPSDPWFRDADVVQLHNTHGSYFSLTALPFLLAAPAGRLAAAATMWAFTGHVAYSYDCERWRHGCGSCPYLAEYPRPPATRPRCCGGQAPHLYAALTPATS